MTNLAPTQYPITALAGVGQPLAKKLAELDIHRIFDLLMHLPRDYEDRSRTVPMNTVENGQVCMIAGVITDVASNKGRLSVCLEDNSHGGGGMVVLQFFKTYPTLLQTMTVGANITAFGEIKVSRYGVQMAHPEYHITGTKTFESGLLPI